MTTSAAEKKEGLSPAAQKGIGVAVILLCLLAGAGIVYFFMFGGSPRKRTVTVDPAKQSVGIEGRLSQDVSPRDMPGVHRLNDAAWRVSTRSGWMVVTKVKHRYRFAYGFGRGFMTPEQIALFASIVRAQTDMAMAKQWEISDEQVAKLKKVNVRQSWLQPSKADQDALAALWDAHVKAGLPRGQSATGERLVEKVEAVAKANLEAGRKAFDARMAKAKQILTAEQLRKLSGG